MILCYSCQRELTDDIEYVHDGIGYICMDCVDYYEYEEIGIIEFEDDVYADDDDDYDIYDCVDINDVDDIVDSEEFKEEYEKWTLTTDEEDLDEEYGDDD